MTLGFIESWYDHATRRYVSIAPTYCDAKDSDRFSFKLLTYQEGYDYLIRAIELLNEEKPKKFVLTTSPVPLNRTFTSQDVIVANNFSKSLLRAISGQIALERDDVDYYPSYENVTISPRDRVWQSDQLHVRNDFVGKVTRRFLESYFGEEVQEKVKLADIEAAAAHHAETGDFEALKECLEQLASMNGHESVNAFWTARGSFSFPTSMAFAEYFFRSGDVETAIEICWKTVKSDAVRDQNLQAGAYLQRMLDMADLFGDNTLKQAIHDKLYGIGKTIEPQARRKTFYELWAGYLDNAGRPDEAMNIRKIAETVA